VDGCSLVISIHASREGSDHQLLGVSYLSQKFQSTLPAREATGLSWALYGLYEISIHASREGSDLARPPSHLWSS